MMKAVHLCEAHGVGLEVHGGGHGNLHALGAMGIAGDTMSEACCTLL